MAGRRKQPVDLIAAKGRKHLTKREYTDRKSQEIQAPNDNIKAPNFLSKKERDLFDEIASTLLEIGIMTNLKSYTNYRKVTKELNKIKFKTDKMLDVEEDVQLMQQYNQFGSLSKVQNRYFKQCIESAKELGLTISSRCKLVMPVSDGEKPINKFSKYVDAS